MIIKICNEKKIDGTVEISGSKNSALPCMVIAMLSQKKVSLENVPGIDDIEIMKRCLSNIGCLIKEDIIGNKVELVGNHYKYNLCFPEIKKIRASSYLMGLVLAKNKKLIIESPGGCSIGERPIDFHLYAFEQMGFIVERSESNYFIKEKKRKPAVITFPKLSVGATINTMILATSIKGKTVITNPSVEPEVIDCVELLQKMGCVIEYINGQLEIVGKTNWREASHRIIPDRMEAGSYMLLGSSLEDSHLVIKNCEPKHMTTVIVVLRSMGVKLIVRESEIEVFGPKTLLNLDLLIGEYPFFPTDLQQILCVALLGCESQSSIVDPIYPDRTSQVKELRKMKGNIIASTDSIVIKNSNLKGCIVNANDLRMAFALVVAGVKASGVTFIENAQLLFRGYVDPLGKLAKIGVLCEVIS